MVQGLGYFPNRPYTLRVETWYNWQSGSAASVHVEVFIDGSYGSYSGCCSSWELQIDSRGTVASWGVYGYDFRYDGSSRRIHVGDYDATVNVNGDIGVHMYANFDVMGYTEAHVAIDGYPLTTPPAPTMLQPDQVTNTGMRVRFSGNGDGGSGIVGWELWRATDAAFTQNVSSVVSSGTTVYTDESPGITYFYKSRGRNAIGLGAFSGVVSQSTLPATAPGMAITPTISGNGATVVLSPPGGITGVTKYTVERRDTGTSSPVSSVDSETNTVPYSGLTPGKSYEWRASAWYGTYQSPFTAWTARVQPNPNTNPGNYFDGSTPLTPALTYSWVGVAGKSESIATGVTPLNWRDFATGAAASGGTGAVFRATGGQQGAWAARAQFFTDATAAGFELGQLAGTGAWSDVDPLSHYYGSIGAWPSRQQRLRAVIKWYDIAGLFISDSVGTPAVCNPGAFTRLLVDADAPANAQWGNTVVEDVTGTGWATWKGGDWLHGDAIMLSLQAPYDYFDGDTPDTDLYNYSWTGAPNASESVRAPLSTVIAVDPLLDPDCAPIPAAPRPPVIIDDCIEEASLWRRYVSIIPAEEVADWQSTLPTLELRTLGQPERQVRIRIYANPFGYDSSQLDAESYCSEQIISYLPPNTTFTIDGELERAFAEVNGGQPLSADHLLYGTGGGPATWPDLSCGIQYLISVDVPPDSLAGNLKTTISLTRRS